MNFADILKQTGAVESISRELGVDQATARNGVEALLPAILGGLLGQMLGGALGGGQAQSGGLGGLAALIDADGDGNPLDDILGLAGRLGR